MAWYASGVFDMSHLFVVTLLVFQFSLDMLLEIDNKFFLNFCVSFTPV